MGSHRFRRIHGIQNDKAKIMKSYGKIKAAYAEIFNQNGDKIYSVQKKAVGDSAIVVTGGNVLENVREDGLLMVKPIGKLVSILGGKDSVVYAKPIAFEWNNSNESNLKPIVLIGGAILGLAALAK